MGILGNILWSIFGGFFSGLGWTIAGTIWCVTIAGIPVGMILMVFRMIQNIIIDFRALKKEKGGEADA